MSAFARLSLILGGLLLAAGCASHSAPPAAVSLVGEWQVESLAGAAPLADAPITLNFMADGRVAGQASCNRYFAAYHQEGAALHIQSPASTMMACPPALMEQEQRFLRQLEGVRAHRMDAAGRLVLESADGAEIVARRR